MSVRKHKKSLGDEDLELLRDIFDADNDGLLDTDEVAKRPTALDRLQRSFQEINNFIRMYNREPNPLTHGVGERKLGARLDGIRLNQEKFEALKPLDEFNLLNVPLEPLTLDEILASTDFDLLSDETGLHDTSILPRRSSRIEPEEVAKRVKVDDFGKFELLFKQKHDELRSGLSKLVPFGGQATIRPGEFFVLNGVMVFVAQVGEPMAVSGKRTRLKRRTRTIYENGTESDLYSRSLASQLYESQGFSVVPSDFQNLLTEDQATGWIYIVRSLSDDPLVSSRNNLFKIGFSTTPVQQRVANSSRESTYLMAPVEIVAEYRTYNLKPSTLEHLLHRVFAEVRLQINQVGFDGRTYDATEWYEVQLPVIDQAINLIINGDIVDYMYDSEIGKLVELE